MIHDLLTEAYAIPQPHRTNNAAPHLYVSEFGQCPRRAILRVLGYQGAPFPAHVQEVMSLGNAYEDDTYTHLQKRLGSAISRQLPLVSDIWSGRVDFVLHKPQRTIIEHKATGDKWFNYNDELPKSAHLAQLILYGWLDRELNGNDPELVLYYRAWGNWAEFHVVQSVSEVLHLDCHINGFHVGKIMPCDLLLRRTMFEDRFKAAVNHQEIPPLPPRPTDAEGCTFQGKPSCGYYELCWGK